MPSRRQFLAGVAASTTAVTGCLGFGDGPEVLDIVVRKAVRYESYSGSGGVLAEDGRQYVVAMVSKRSPKQSTFSLDADGTSWDAGLSDTRGGTNRSVAGRKGGPAGQGYADTDGFVAFDVPSPLSVDQARITAADGIDTEFSSPQRDSLAAAEPTFELRDLQAPSALSQGDSLEVTMTVENTSETDGRFLAAVYWPTEAIADDDESHIVERSVAAGESMTASRAIDTGQTARDAGPVTLRIEGHVTADRVVDVAVDGDRTRSPGADSSSGPSKSS